MWESWRVMSHAGVLEGDPGVLEGDLGVLEGDLGVLEGDESCGSPGG